MRWLIFAAVLIVAPETAVDTEALVLLTGTPRAVGGDEPIDLYISDAGHSLFAPWLLTERNCVRELGELKKLYRDVQVCVVVDGATYRCEAVRP